MTRFQILKEFWGKSLEWKFSIISLAIQFPAFIFHELCHLFLLGMYMFIFSDYQKLNYAGSYFIKKISDNQLGGYSLYISWTSYSNLWSIIVAVAPLIGYISLWLSVLISYFYRQFPFHLFALSVWYLLYSFGQFMLSKEDVSSIEITMIRAKYKNRGKLLILTNQVHKIIKRIKPWQYE
mgnify:FL=1